MKTIQEYRLALGLTIQGICKKLNISKNQYYRIVSGKAELSEVELVGLDSMPKKRGPKKKESNR